MKAIRDQATLASLGMMVVTLAHEIRNPLTGIRGAIQVIGGCLPAGGRDALIVPDILARIDDLSSMLTDLLLFARPPGVQKMPVDMTALVTNTVTLFKRDPALDALRVDVAGRAVTVMADQRLMDIVFRNLLLNSAHAVGGCGRIHVSVHAFRRVCRVKITDNGPGIPPEIRDKVFHPFFTTKERGTGLGLSTAKRFVEAHDGIIAVTVPPLGGTVVTVRLPLGA
jgi:two-component system sensor histidine kinase PilS (NtrC family)